MRQFAGALHFLLGKLLHTHKVVWQGGATLASPRLDDKSPTALQVQGPVRVGERWSVGEVVEVMQRAVALRSQT